MTFCLYGQWNLTVHYSQKKITWIESVGGNRCQSCFDVEFHITAFVKIQLSFYWAGALDVGCKLNLQKTFRLSLERLMYVQSTSCVEGVVTFSFFFFCLYISVNLYLMFPVPVFFRDYLIYLYKSILFSVWAETCQRWKKGFL